MKKALLLLFLPLLMSCASQLYTPLESVGNIPLADLKKGRETYVNNCASCHSLYMPEKYSNVQWAENLEEMQQKAKITDFEKAQIYGYLSSHPRK